MKILKIQLENFESHVNTIIEFDPNFNCIVGPTNTGKTAIFNAILFVLFNEWDPGFIRKGTDFCKVIMETDSFVIERIRGETVNTVIIKKDGQEYKFDNFGKSYPDEIKNLIKLSNIDDYLAFIGFQDNNSFLIHESSTTRSAYIGKITGLNLLNETIRNVSLEIKQVNTEISQIEREKKNIEQSLKKLQFLDKLEILVNKLEDLEKKIASLQEQNKTFSFYKEAIKNLDNRIVKVQDVLDKLGPVDFDSYYQTCENFLSLFNVYGDVQRVDVSIERNQTLLKNTISEIDNKITSLITLLKEKGICPLCGSHLDSSSIDYIFQDLV
jgi:exonuclease SbcC